MVDYRNGVAYIYIYDYFVIVVLLLVMKFLLDGIHDKERYWQWLEKMLNSFRARAVFIRQNLNKDDSRTERIKIKRIISEKENVITQVYVDYK